MKLRGVIFDMDGTLIDSREIVLGAFKHVFEEVGQPYDETVVRSHVGRLLEEQYRDLIPTHDPAKLAELHRSWQADNKQLLKGFDGLNEFLDKLKDMNLKLGLFTSAIRARAQLALDGLDIGGYFDAVICG